MNTSEDFKTVLEHSDFDRASWGETSPDIANPAVAAAADDHEAVQNI